MSSLEYCWPPVIAAVHGVHVSSLRRSKAQIKNVVSLVTVLIDIWYDIGGGVVIVKVNVHNPCRHSAFRAGEPNQ